MRSAVYCLLLLPMLVLPASCTHDESTTVIIVPPEPRPVSILVEVFDPVTNYVWEGVSVRVVEASHEWSGHTVVSPFEDWFPTDHLGEVFLDEFVLGDAEVGFLVDSQGGALIGSQSFEDEATVVLEIDAIGFVPVFVEVDLRWDDPDVFLSVPFEPIL